MLVLTRKVTEKLYIGQDICITVVRLEGGQVRLGIEAPRQIPVVRAELIPGSAADGRPLARPVEAAPEAPAVTPPPTTPTSPLGIDIRRRVSSR